VDSGWRGGKGSRATESVWSLKQFGDKWVQTEADVHVPDTMASQAIRDHHTQVLRLAEEALEKVPMNRREYAALTMAIDSKKIGEFKSALKELRRKFCVEAQKSTDTDQVYCFALQFFPLSGSSAGLKNGDV
jgi:uncharacterized protein (TIGR02147 family)